MTADQLQAARHRLGLTQQALADRLEVARNTVSRMETGDMPVDKQVAQLVEYYERERLGLISS